ncbi:MULTISPECIES: tetratricopeptide repeat protein [unclassified Rhizobium]|uniref:tetratricopeptide repeat protein n=1 Tax=unclassified Rhizobium TaxID=2613769 RepID=UPI00104418B9|nr:MULTISPECIES: tetratricopeptide repeat protein [unclassified Rhizobium]MBB4166774.1 Flp pilus assembly protein TadD [Rhizobium sp. BK538]TCM77500.1 Flp pilus assembly protein TadD [Rhizobium sp. BK068]
MPASANTLLETRVFQGVATALVVLALAGCTTTKDRMTTGSVPTLTKPVETMNEVELRSSTERVGQAYEKNPRDAANGVNYANLLRMQGRDAQALAVMQQVAIANPNDRNVLAAYGKAQAAAGQLQQALDTIGRAQTPDRPDWKLTSAEGAILDQLGRSAEARQRYREALDIQPGEASILSNLGMSYVLTGDLRTAETYLRQAAEQPTADSRVRQNLALVIGLQGRFPEAEKIARGELSQLQADANVAYLRSMLSQQNSWQKLAAKDSASSAPTSTN